MSKKIVISLVPTLCLCWAGAMVARIGGYSHRSIDRQAAPQQIVVQAVPNTVTIPSTVNEHTPVRGVVPPGPVHVKTPAETILAMVQPPPVPSPSMSGNELVQMLEEQNSQLRDQISTLEQEGRLLLRRNRQLLTDKRRLQRKRRKLVEKLDALEERILEVTSRTWRRNKQLAMRTSDMKEHDA